MQKILIILVLLIAVSVPAAGEPEISGFVDSSYFMNTLTDGGEFGLDQVEIDIVHSSGERTALRADIEWVKDGEGFSAQLEQGFMSYDMPRDWTFIFGKFNAPIGFELLDAPDMYQFSHALVFDHGLPTNLSGAAISRPLGERFDFIGYLSNGWDANAIAGDKTTWGGRLGFGRDSFGGGVSMISGEQDMDLLGTGTTTPVSRTVVDIDLSYVSGPWTFGGEYNSGGVTVGGADQDWSGYLLMANRAVGETGGLTFRYDYFDDPDGWAFGAGETRQAFTISPSLVLDENFLALIELRLDKSDIDAFIDADGAAEDSAVTVAFEMTYGW